MPSGDWSAQKSIGPSSPFLRIIIIIINYYSHHYYCCEMRSGSVA